MNIYQKKKIAAVLGWLPESLNPEKLGKLQKDLIWASAVFALAFLFYYFSFLSHDEILLVPNIFQARDIHRAIDLYSNSKWIWFGPELSGGGHLPGPFYYYLIGLPIWLTGSVSSLYAFCFGLASAAVSIMWFQLKRQYSLLSAMVFCVLFLSSSFNNMMLVHFWNPSFQFLFFAGAFCCFQYPSSNKRLALGAFLIGLSLQIHLIALVFLVGQLLQICIFENFSRAERLKKAGYLLFFAAIPLMPYTYFRLFLLENSGPAFELIGAPGRLLFLFKWSAIVSFFETSILDLVKDFIHQILASFFVLPGLAYIFLFRREFSAKYFPKGIAICASFLLVYNLPSILFDRYQVPLYFFAGFAFSLAVAHAKAAKLKFFLPLAVYCSLYLILGSREIYLTHPEYTRMSVRTGTQLVSVIAETTGWDFDYYRTHSFIVGLHIFDDFSYIYPANRKIASGSGSQKFDGLFALGRDKHSFLKPTGEVDTAFLRTQSLPSNLADALDRKTISCEKVTSVAGFEICFYKFSSKVLRSVWHNIGFGYDYRVPFSFLLNPGTGIASESENSALLYVNPCPSPDKNCNMFFRVSILAANRLSVEIEGAPLAAGDMHIHPPAGANLTAPKLLVECGSRKQEIPIASSLGPRGSGGPDGPAFHTPFLDFYDIDCARPQKITVLIDKKYIHFPAGNGGERPWRKYPFKVDWIPKQNLGK